MPLVVALSLTAILDLGTKAVAVSNPEMFGPGVIYNPSTSHLALRIAICLVSVAVVMLLTKLAHWRGIGHIPLVWVSCGILVGAVLAQGASTVIWADGVPDFIWMRGWVWNLADFSIGVGMLLFLAASIGYAVVAFARDLAKAPPA